MPEYVKERVVAGWREELRALAASLGSRVRRGTNALERLVDHDPYRSLRPCLADCLLAPPGGDTKLQRPL
ncbi:MAG TPA: hypothetical protein VIG04_01805 [Gemmatimonadales bacterium]